MTKVFKVSSLASHQWAGTIQNLLQIVFGNPTADHLKGGGSAKLLEDDAHNLRVLTNE